jgi:hypothetical protein
MVSFTMPPMSSLGVKPVAASAEATLSKGSFSVITAQASS